MRAPLRFCQTIKLLQRIDVTVAIIGFIDLFFWFRQWIVTKKRVAQKDETFARRKY